MGSSPTRGSSFSLGKVTALGVLCCFALIVVCLTLLASFFLPSLTCVYNYIYYNAYYLCLYMYTCIHLYLHVHVLKVCPGEGGDEAVRNGETQTRADSQKDGVGGREGVGGRGSSGPSTPSLSVTTTSAVRERDVEKEKELTAGLVRSAIAAQPPVAMATVAMANVAGKPAAVQTQRSVTDPSALPGAQALAVLANVSGCM